ncbi:hypothetical protein RFI_05648 [Reticulomyxa filosa]|uniref:Uncharacterized protein n=1 Tax=Reticulomyxa filosa TaxID=46433 RepID=X6P1P5_RETFI|nr:hypothetical protein RFI_05648 [Reticulomyxa filosa]|eukprot:ETO31472.1 hypothetical protein RFI_05648 [Reticulomyxa filosa]
MLSFIPTRSLRFNDIKKKYQLKKKDCLHPCQKKDNNTDLQMGNKASTLIEWPQVEKYLNTKQAQLEPCDPSEHLERLGLSVSASKDDAVSKEKSDEEKSAAKENYLQKRTEKELDELLLAYSVSPNLHQSQDKEAKESTEDVEKRKEEKSKCLSKSRTPTFGVCMPPFIPISSASKIGYGFIRATEIKFSSTFFN